MADQPQIALPLDLVNAVLVALGECKAKDVFNIINSVQNIALPQVPEELRNPPAADPAPDASAAPADPAPDASAAPADTAAHAV